MKILQVISSVNPEGGGPVEVLKRLGQELERTGHVAEVACLDDLGAQWLGGFPLTVHALGPGLFKYGFSGRFVPWLRENAPRFDCVLVHGIWQYSSYGVWLALRGSKTPYLVCPHGMLDPWFNRAYPLKHLKKILYWNLAEYGVLRDARAVVFTCEEERNLARKSFSPYKLTEAVVSYGTASPEGDAESQRRAFLEKFPEASGKRVVLFLGRIHEKKGCDILIEAFSKAALKDPVLHLVVAGPDQTGLVSELKALAERLGVGKRITWTGMLSGDLKWGAFRLADVFVLPSHQENFGVAAVEALACGVPVLLSDKVNIWREISGCKAGLVAGDDVAGVSGLLEKWLSMSPKERDVMRRKALGCFSEKFEIHNLTTSLLNILKSNGVVSGAGNTEG